MHLSFGFIVALWTLLDIGVRYIVTRAS